MTIHFALVSMMNEWTDRDTFATCMAIVLLGGWVIYRKGKSAYACWALAGASVAGIYKVCFTPPLWGTRALVLDGILLGIVCAWICRRFLGKATRLGSERAAQPETPSKPKNTLDWTILSVITFTALAAWLSFFFQSEEEWFLITAAGAVTGACLGAITGTTIARRPIARNLAELIIAGVVGALVGLVMGWRFVWPKYYYEIAPTMTDDESELMFYRVIRISVGCGIALGTILWSLRAMKRIVVCDKTPSREGEKTS